MNISAIFVSLSCILALAVEPRTWTFETDTVGQAAEGFSTEVGIWTVVKTKEGKALAQTAKSPGTVFNVVLVDSVRVKNVDLSVKIKRVAGVDDQGGGLVWRAKDSKNYYVARFNHLEDNLRLYKVVDGKRTMFLSADVKHSDDWSTLRVIMQGDQIACFLDGKKMLEFTDATFPEPGKIGLWSKADAQTWFADLKLVEL